MSASSNFQFFVMFFYPFYQSVALFFFWYIQEKLDDFNAVICQIILKIFDVFVAFFPYIFAFELVWYFLVIF